MKKIFFISVLLFCIILSGCSSNDVDVEKYELFELEDLPFSEQQVKKINAALSSSEENIRFEMSEDKGEISYNNFNLSWTDEGAGMSMTEKEAISMAEDFLRSLKILPKDEYFIETSAVGGSTLDVAGGTEGETETVCWDVYFANTYNGIKVYSGDEDEIYEGIRVEIVKYEIKELNYKWSKIIPTGEFLKKESLKSFDQAKAIFLEERRNKSCCPDHDEMYMEMSIDDVFCEEFYYYEDGETILCYRLGDNEDFVNGETMDALTGEMLYF